MVAGAVAALSAAAAGAWLWKAWNTPYRGYAGDGVFVEIPRGMNSSGIARLLEESGVVRSQREFVWLCRLWKRRPLQAGEYRFERAMTPLEVHRVLAEGRVYLRSITIPEGWTRFEIAEELERAGIVPRKKFLAATADASEIQDLAPGARSLEGFLFPATYQFTRKATAKQVAGAMVARFREVWGSLAKNGGNERAGEIVTLASLVEREARAAEERALIAGVYRNRLERGMALQCDPTVVYGLMLDGKWDGKIGYADLKYNSPYNTYLHRGLPPGPIANPGAAALEAALQPAKTDYLYFVADTRGRHFFSKTLAEHNRNVQRYLRLLREEERAAAGGESRSRNSPKGR